MVSSHSQNPRLWSFNNLQSLHETVRHDFNVGVWVSIPRHSTVVVMKSINS